MGFFSPFFICGGAMALEELLESTLEGMGYELVDVEQLAHSKLLRVFVDKEGGITIDDCVTISNHLSRLLIVENIDYGRLEVLREVNDGIIKLEVEGKLLDLELSNLGKARLVPKL